MRGTGPVFVFDRGRMCCGGGCWCCCCGGGICDQGELGRKGSYSSADGLGTASAGGSGRPLAGLGCRRPNPCGPCVILIAGSMGDSIALSKGHSPGGLRSSSCSPGDGANGWLGGMGREKSRGGDLFSRGSSALMPGFWCLMFSPATRMPLSSPYASASKLRGEKVSMLLAALPIGLRPPVLLLVLLMEFSDEAVDEPDPEGRC